MTKSREAPPLSAVPQEDLAALADGARIAGAMPYIENTIGKMEKALDARVFGMIRDGALTPDAALAAWMERHSLDSLRRRLTTQVRVGISAGERLKPAMEGDQDDGEG